MNDTAAAAPRISAAELDVMRAAADAFLASQGTGYKRRSLWIAAEDAPDGKQIEEADLDVLLTRMEHAITR